MTSDNVQETAADWFIKMKTTKDVDVLWSDFYQWINAKPEHREAYLKVERAWRITHQEISPAKGGTRSPAAAEFVRRAHDAANARLARRATIRGAIAACVVMALIAVALGFWGFHYMEIYAWNRYETSYGEFRPVTLADGSTIELNTNSRLWVRMTRGSRDVALEQGEAFFKVEPDGTRPFIVQVNHDLVQATGTEFSVNRQSEGKADALVRKGSIEVSDLSAGDSVEKKEGTTVVKEGQIVTITPDHTDVGKADLAAVERSLAWTKGKIDFDGRLADAVVEFNRYNRRRLEIVDRRIENKHMQGLFRATDPDTFAEKVREQFGIPISSTGSAAARNGTIRLGARLTSP